MTNCAALISRDGARDPPSLRAQQIVQIEWHREHRLFTVRSARPRFAGPVPVKLDAVLVGIAQINRFADAVIAGPLKGNVCRGQSSQGISQGGAGWVKNSEM